MISGTSVSDSLIEGDCLVEVRLIQVWLYSFGSNCFNISSFHNKIKKCDLSVWWLKLLLNLPIIWISNLTGIFFLSSLNSTTFHDFFQDL